METIEHLPIASLKEAARNSRKHTDAQVAQIAASMQQFGWTIPVIVDESGVLIAGHARIRAAKTLGYETAPCLVAAGWSEEKKTAYQIADNKLAENSSWDDAILREQIVALSAADFSLDVLGFPSFQIDGILGGQDESLFDLPTNGEAGETPEGFQKAKEPTKTEDGMVQFTLVIPVAEKKKAMDKLRKIIASGDAETYSQAFCILIGAAKW